MVHQWNVVNAAFSDRIREYIKARTDLETHLAKVRTPSQPRVTVTRVIEYTLLLNDNKDDTDIYFLF